MKSKQKIEMLLKSLHLTTFLKNYEVFAEKAEKTVK